MTKEPGQYPYITLRVNLDTKDDWKKLRNVKNDDKGSKGKNFRKTNYNLTILVIRNDGLCFDMRHTRSVLPEQDKGYGLTIQRLDLFRENVVVRDRLRAYGPRAQDRGVRRR